MRKDYSSEESRRSVWGENCRSEDTQGLSAWLMVYVLFWLSLDETYRNRCIPPWWGRGRGPEHPGPVGTPESPGPPEPLSAGAQRGVPCLQPPTPRSSSSPAPPQRFTSINLDVLGSCQQVAVFRFDQPSCSCADFDEAEDNKRNKPACIEKNGW